MTYEYRFFHSLEIPDDLVQFKAELEKEIRDKSGNPLCDYYALIIDNTDLDDVKIAGMAKAKKFDLDVSQKLLKGVSPVLKSQDKPNPDDIIVYIESVDIYDRYQGTGLCNKLVKFCMNEIRKNQSKLRFFLIYNASFTFDGIPACRCYVGAGIDGGYDVYFDDYKNHWFWGEYSEKKKMSKEKCITGNQMPREYMFVMPKIVGGKKRSKTRRSKTRRSKTRRSKTRRSKTRRIYF
jgi:hypothetical protein